MLLKMLISIKAVMTLGGLKFECFQYVGRYFEP